MSRWWSVRVISSVGLPILPTLRSFHLVRSVLRPRSSAIPWVCPSLVPLVWCPISIRLNRSAWRLRPRPSVCLTSLRTPRLAFVVPSSLNSSFGAVIPYLPARVSKASRWSLMIFLLPRVPPLPRERLRRIRSRILLYLLLFYLRRKCLVLGLWLVILNPWRVPLVLRWVWVTSSDSVSLLPRYLLIFPILGCVDFLLLTP